MARRRRGAAFRAAVEDRYGLVEVIDEALVQEIATTLDLLDNLRTAVRRDGLTVAGSMGQTRVHPAVASIAQAQSVLDRLIARVRDHLDDGRDDWDALVEKLSTPVAFGQDA